MKNTTPFYAKSAHMLGALLITFSIVGTAMAGDSTRLAVETHERVIQTKAAHIDGGDDSARGGSIPRFSGTRPTTAVNEGGAGMSLGGVGKPDVATESVMFAKETESGAHTGNTESVDRGIPTLVGATGVGEANARAAAPAIVEQKVQAATTPTMPPLESRAAAVRVPLSAEDTVRTTAAIDMRGIGQLASGSAFKFKEGGLGGTGSKVVCVYNCDGQSFRDRNAAAAPHAN